MLFAEEHLGRGISQATSGGGQSFVIRLEMSSTVNAQSSANERHPLINSDKSHVHSKIAQDETRMLIPRAVQDVLRFQVSMNDVMRVQVGNGLEDRSSHPAKGRSSGTQSDGPRLKLKRT